MLPVIGESRVEPYRRLREHGYRRVAIHREPALEFAEQSSAVLSGRGLASSAFAEIDAGPGKARSRPRSPLCALRQMRSPCGRCLKALRPLQCERGPRRRVHR